MTNRNIMPEYEIELTSSMIDAGVEALHAGIGYQYNGEANKVVRSVFQAMLNMTNIVERLLDQGHLTQRDVPCKHCGRLLAAV